jgi:mannose-6-phosphate isomerase-like protein (cupin superfamily)
MSRHLIDKQSRITTPTHINLRDVEWTSSEQYPDELRKIYRYKALIGGNWSGVMPHDEVFMGILELAPKTTYPAHQHPAPEIYYVISGIAEWSVDDETFVVESGTAIHHHPNALHRMVNIGDDVLRLVYFWWSPNGNQQVLKVASKLLEPVPKQPVQATFLD